MLNQAADATELPILQRQVDGDIQTYQPMPPELRPQDPHRDGTGLQFETSQHGWHLTPEVIKLTDPQGRWCLYHLDHNDGIAPEDRPRDATMNGQTLQFEMVSHGGDYEDDMPQWINVSDAQGRWCFYYPSKIDGEVVRRLGVNLAGRPVDWEARIRRIDRLPRF